VDPLSARRRGAPRGGALGLALAVLALGACTLVPPPPATGPAARDPEAAWARVLRDFVAEDGAIDFDRLRADRADLAAYVAWVAEHGPESTPARFASRERRLAYSINAYNAVAMHHVVSSDARPAQLLRFFVNTYFRIDGRWRSLYSFENDDIRPLGEPRAHFALNCMVRDCPRLPRRPFTAEALDAELTREARRFLAEPRNVQVDPRRRIVRFNEILRFYAEDFLAAAPTLIAYANRYRAEAIPEEYQVRFVPYDWSLHQR
jgi:hypothetical protein